MITLTREEAQQVLDAFEVATTHFAKDRQEILAARETLRARLAQPDVMINGLTEEETAATMSVKGLTQPEPPCKTGSQCVGGKCTQCAQPDQEPVAWRFDQAKYRENDLRGRRWAFNVFSQTKPYMDEMVRNVTPLYKDPTPCQTCEALARTVMMDQASHDTRLQRERVKFPTMLRKMWSGSEVQAWLDETVNKENKR